MSEAEIRFNEAFRRSINAWRIILSFHTATQAGFQVVAAQIFSDMRAFMDDLIGRGQTLIKDPETFIKSGEAARMAQKAAENTITDAASATDGACILFAHSVLDAAAWDFCNVTALARPDDWTEDIKNRRFELSELQAGRTFEELRAKALTEFFDKLERESLLKKIDLLYARCQPPAKYSIVKGYEFDREHLMRLDRLRHEIVHRDGLGKLISDTDKEIDYMMLTNWHLMSLVTLRYGLQLEVSSAFDAPSA